MPAHSKLTINDNEPQQNIFCVDAVHKGTRSGAHDAHTHTKRTHTEKMGKS